MHPTVQLLQRNATLFSNACWHLACPADAEPLSYWPEHQATTLEFTGTQPVTGFGLEPLAQKPTQGIIYFPKAKAEAKLLLYWAASQLTPDSQLYLVGENKGGIKSAPALLKKSGLSCTKIDSARHCSLMEIHDWQTLAAQPFKLDDWYQSTTIDNEISLWSLPGVFSHGKVDPGTRILLPFLPTLKAKQSALDLGCGCGIIGTNLLKKQPEAQVDFSDVNWLALTSTRMTCNKNNLHCHDIIASDGLKNITGQYDLIVSNPPFHQGIKTHYQATELFLQNASNHLKPGGQLLIVANQFLTYEPIIEQAFGHCHVLASDKGFKVLSAQR